MEKFKFELEFEESLMQRTVNKAFKKIYPSSELRKNIEGEKKINKEVHKLLSDQGFLGMLNPAKHDDMNLMLCTILVTEAGRRLLAFPLIEHLMGLFILKQEAISTEIAEFELGKKIATIGWHEELEFKLIDGEYHVNGIIKSIPFAVEADQIMIPIKKKKKNEKDQVLIIKTTDYRSQFRCMKVQDLTYPLFELKLNNIKIDGYSVKRIELDLIDFCNVSDLLLAAELLGISQETLNMTLNYSKERKQFGVEIGKFQALKHMLADMHLLCESSKISVEFGAWTLENKGEDYEIISSISKAYSSDAAIRIVEHSIQIHGAIGFSWEHDLPFYLKRAYRLANMFKTPYEEREKIAAYLIKDSSDVSSKKGETINN